MKFKFKKLTLPGVIMLILALLLSWYLYKQSLGVQRIGAECAGFHRRTLCGDCQ